MKILYIIPTLDRGGAEIILLNICRELKKLEVPPEINIITLLRKGILAIEFENIGIPVSCVKNPTGKIFDNFFYSYRYIRTYKPDIVHTHLWMADKSGITAAYIARVKKKFFTIHNYETVITSRDLLWNVIVCQLCTKAVSVSNAVKTLWVKNRFFSKNKIITIYNCAGFSSTKKYLSRLKCSDSLKLLSLGRIDPAKGLEYVISAMPELLHYHSSVSLDIYGPCYNPLYLNSIEEIIKNNSLKNHVTFKGPVTNSLEIFPQYDILIIPSLYEGFGMVSIEGMSCGIPIVASNIPVHNEIFENGKSGIIVDEKSPKALSTAVQKLYSDPSLYSSMSLAGLNRSKAFNIQTMIKAYKDLYCIGLSE